MNHSSTRRGFLKKTTGAGLLICSSRVAFGYQANERLNLAMIGAGGRADESIRKVGTENIVALCDVDERRAASARKKHPDARFFRDFRQLLSEMPRPRLRENDLALYRSVSMSAYGRYRPLV